MPDYNLAGLSTRSFEQLVQAIAAKVIGQGVIVFGDGRDGGREATFEGAIPYAPNGETWTGYGVVQAKFKQRPRDTKTDGEWALKQLRAELQDFADPKKGRRKPDYYIFATNVVLTPFPEAGSKDKVFELFDEFKSSLPLKGYDIWDYDKLRVFLDDNESIRRGYAAWITPGDVLSQVIEWLKPSRADFEQTLTRYLQEELLTDQFANLEQAGHAGDDRIPVARVFVDLPTFDRYMVEPPETETDVESLRPGFIAEILRTATARLDPQSWIPRSGLPTLDSSTEQEPGRFALIGGPGQGKTTIGQYVCQLFRTAILNDKPDWVLDPEVRNAIQTIISQLASDGFNLPTARRFPIRIVLNKFAKALASKEESRITSLLGYIIDRIRRKTDQEVSVEDFRKWLAAFPWIIILDGLDEVPASSNRDEVLAAIRSFRLEARGCNADLLIISTTRPQGYSEEFSPNLFRHRYLAPLSPARAMLYGQRLVSVRHAGDQERKDKILSRLQRASERAATARLMQSPLQVTIMAALVDRMGQPPQERWNLFKEYYNVIYQREVERDIPAAAILRDYKSDVDTIHKHVGLLLQVESESSGKTDARLSAIDFSAVVEARLRNAGHEGEECERLKESIIEAATDRLVFLVGLEADEVGFEIRSLQEFMAAEGLMAGSDIDIRNRLRGIAPNANWRNVLLFAVGKISAERDHLLDAIYAICMELNEDEEDKVARTILAGSQLALDLLEDTPIKQQPNNARNLARIALRLLDIPPSEHHVRIGDLYQSALEAVYREELTIRLRHVDFDERLGALTCLIRLIDADVQWANNFKDEQWPEEADKQLGLLKINDIAEGQKWLQSKIVDIIPSHSPKNLYPFFVFGQLTTKRSDGSRPSWGSTVETILDEDPMVAGLVEIPVLETPTSGGSFYLNVLSIGEESSWLIPLKDMPFSSPAWAPFVSGAQFLERPSKATLARELRVLASVSNVAVVDWWSMMLPWPLAICLLGTQDQLELRSLADKVEAGELGDTDDWHRAEVRWRRQGITVEDITTLSDEHLILNPNIAHKGFPFSVGSWGMNHSGNYNDLLRRLLAVYSQIGGMRAAKDAAYWIITILSYRYDEISINSTESTLERFRFLARDIFNSRYHFNLASVRAIQWAEPISDEWVDFIDYLGRQRNSTLSRHFPFTVKSEKLMRRISAAFINNPDKVGLLRILSFYALDGGDISIPSNLLNPDHFDSDVYRHAAVIITVMQEQRSEVELTFLAEHLAQFIKNQEFAAEFDRIVENLRPGSDTDLLYIKLRALMPPSAWEATGKVCAALEDSMKRRTSQLFDPKIWSSLNLPTGLTPLLRS